jgi:tRNA (guanine37-N1)-methyltransferase
VLFTFLTLFPELVDAYAKASILGGAQAKGIIKVEPVDFRDFTRDRHRTVDDRPFGGGPGMVLKPEPILDAVEWLERRSGPFRKIMLTPTGRPFDQAMAKELSEETQIMLLAGRYEGFDERVREECAWDEISMGDFVLCGGELPGLSVIEAVSRLLPGVLGDDESAVQDSFQAGGGLDHPHYTRPRVFRGRAVPDVLLSGDHAAIAAWRKGRALERTLERRPDLVGSKGERATQRDKPRQA